MADLRREAERIVSSRSNHRPPEPAIVGCIAFMGTGMVLIIFCALAGLDIEDFASASTITTVVFTALAFLSSSKKEKDYNAEVEEVYLSLVDTKHE